MAAGFLSPPGTEYGPCVDACGHRDCAAARRHAMSACTKCGRPIGYDMAFYNGGDGDWTELEHLSCDVVLVSRPPEEQTGRMSDAAAEQCREIEGGS